jgi:hypothetical protein
LIESTQLIKDAHIELIDLSGRVVEQKIQSLPAGITAIQFSTELNAGTYLIRIQSENSSFKPVHVVVH